MPSTPFGTEHTTTLSRENVIQDRTTDISALRERVGDMEEYLRIEDKRAEAARLEQQAAEPGFWDDAQAAQAVMAQLSAARDDVKLHGAICAALDDIEVANELAVEGDEDMAAEVEATLGDLVKRVDTLEVATWFSGEFDGGDAIITIVPGQGGLEAQDWTEMLMKMYMKYAERAGWKVDLHDAPEGTELGIDRAVFTMHGRNAYGMLLSEAGVHRLVRISPTDEKKRRQTTFAGVEVLPVLPQTVELDIKDDDLRIDVFRSSGPGGQSVNTTDSAVRITHLPTGLVVSCQNEKSQLKNKETAMTILRSRVFELEEQKRLEELDALRGERKDISFGSQIRNYVLYPYQLVKDVRTGIETGNVDAVLAGDIEDFILGYHRWRVTEQEPARAGSGS